MQLERYVAIIGSRNFSNWEQLKEEVGQIIRPDDTIVSGGAIGADSMAQRIAKENGLKMIIFYPNYTRYARGAPFVRNKLIAEQADIVLAFYSKGRFQQGGTLHTVEKAKELGKKVYEFNEI